MSEPLSVFRAVLFVFAFGTVGVDAHIAAYYDLASLYHSADVVVKAEAGEFVRERAFNTGKVRVTETFKGKFEAGDQIDVAIKVEAGTAKVTPMYMFLVHRGQGVYMPISNGIKFVCADGIYSYRLNHVPLLPDRVPQWAESDRGTVKKPCSEKQLRADIESARLRIKKLMRAKETNDVSGLSQIATTDMTQSQWNTDELSFEAAQTLAEHYEPDVVIRCLKTGRTLFPKTEAALRRGFATPTRFQFLWPLIQDESPESDALLALELMQSNKAAGYFREAKPHERGELQREFSDDVVRRVTALMTTSASPDRIAGASGVLRAWARHKEGIESEPMKAIRAAIEPPRNASVRHILIRNYCLIGGKDAYRELFSDEVFLIGDPPAGLDASSISIHAIDTTRWKIMQMPPVLTATSLDDGRTVRASADDQTVRRWKKLRTTAGEFVDEFVVGNQWAETLKPGRYLLCANGEYRIGGESKVWRGLPKEIVVE